jgi:type II secretory pathway pseudopilin PulG
MCSVTIEILLILRSSCSSFAASPTALPSNSTNVNAMSKTSHLGVTVVELLVTIGIITALAAMLFPAVQAARERARSTQCQSSLRQLGAAFLAHEDAHAYFPTGGWGWGWQGDPDRGYSKLQPGGWPYALLPFIEQTALREQGSGLPPQQKRFEVRLVAEHPLSLFVCPSRRPALPYPFVHQDGFFNIDRPDYLAPSDYAANVGDQKPGLYGTGPQSLSLGDSAGYIWQNSVHTGVVFRRSEIRSGEVADGTSATYLVGEKFLAVNHYATGEGTNDNQGLYVGADRDTLCSTHNDFRPRRDANNVSSDHTFGSAHATGLFMAFCDGSVRKVSYSISSEIHRRLGNRHDGQPVSDLP